MIMEIDKKMVFGLVRCAKIDYVEYDGDGHLDIVGSGEICLKENHTKESFEKFIDKLKALETSLTERCIFSGTIWYKDGTFSKAEKRGRCTIWALHKAGEIPPYMLSDDKSQEKTSAQPTISTEHIKIMQRTLGLFGKTKIGSDFETCMNYHKSSEKALDYLVQIGYMCKMKDQFCCPGYYYCVTEKGIKYLEDIMMINIIYRKKYILKNPF